MNPVESTAAPIVHTLDGALARRIQIVGLDVDGTLTDGGVYLGASEVAALGNSLAQPHAPFELKRYDIQDGLGIWLLRSAAIKVVIVTGRVSHSVAHRARELDLDAVRQEPNGMKLGLWRTLLHEFNLTNAEAAFVGDDLPDLPILREVALPVAVGNSVVEVQRACSLHLTRRGGFGAVREFSEVLLQARGEWNGVVERYVTSRSVTEVSAPAAAVVA
ncbi:MAG: HAD hydrolase family protein [Phycisphaerae bacterium]|nr:HAD hydrolase family protein [Gemmatimonadaceae bacterium]